MPNKSTRRATSIAARRRQVAVLYMRGLTQPEIAAELKVSQPTISIDLKWLRADWMERARASFDQVKAAELARIDQLEREYLDAWERSKQPASTATQASRTLPLKRGLDVAPKISDARVVKTARDGDPRFLAGVQWCIEKRLQLFGLTANGEAAAGDKPPVDWRAIVAGWGMDPDEFMGAVRQARLKTAAPPSRSAIIEVPASVAK